VEKLEPALNRRTIGGMTPRQLANVLIKILGLSLCAHGITPVIQLFMQILGPDLSFQMSRSIPSLMSGNFQLCLLASVLPIGIGLVLIIFSKSIVAILFRDEE
jgi:hypothetical protein